MDCGEQTVGVRLARLIAFEDARHGGGPTTRGKKMFNFQHDYRFVVKTSNFLITERVEWYLNFLNSLS